MNGVLRQQKSCDDCNSRHKYHRGLRWSNIKNLNGKDVEARDGRDTYARRGLCRQLDGF